MAPSSKLELARFSAKLRIQDGAECGHILKLSEFVISQFVKIIGWNEAAWVTGLGPLYTVHSITITQQIFETDMDNTNKTVMDAEFLV